MHNFPSDLQHVAVYLRKSRADVEAEARGEGETLSKHRRTLMELAKRYRYGIDDIFEEIVSGDRILDRPEMQRLLQAVQSNTYTAVLCMDIDRLGRGNMIDQGLIQETFKSSRTLIVTPRKVYNLEDEMDEEWSEFEAFMARRELKIITRRMQRGRRDSARDGKHVAKKPPYGYLRGDDLRLYPDPETAPIVRQMFAWSAEGLGHQVIARKLVELGVPTPAGKKLWQTSSIYAIFKNPVYLGHVTWGRIRYRKGSGDSKYDRERQPEENWIIHENAHEPLVDAETYARHLEASARKPKVSYKKTLANPLASLVFCSQCNRAMVRRPRHNRPHDQLLCHTLGCDTRGINFDLVEDRVLSTLREMLADFRFERKRGFTRKNDGELALLRRKADELTTSIEELQMQRNNLHDLLERGIYDADTFLERNRVISERLEGAERDLTEVESKAADIESRLAQRTDTYPQLVNVLKNYERAATAKEKNDLLKTVIDRIEYTRKQTWTKRDQFEIEITLRF